LGERRGRCPGSRHRAPPVSGQAIRCQVRGSARLNRRPLEPSPPADAGTVFLLLRRAEPVGARVGGRVRADDPAAPVDDLGGASGR
jgi:hypothetical protein